MGENTNIARLQSWHLSPHTHIITVPANFLGVWNLCTSKAPNEDPGDSDMYTFCLSESHHPGMIV